jgi:transcriptional regulator with XRE-family HTH domain
MDHDAEARRQCGRRLRDARESLRLSQASLGVDVGVGQPAVAKWENGVTEPDLAKRRLLAAVLGTDPYAIEPTAVAATAAVEPGPSAERVAS